MGDCYCRGRAGEFSYKLRANSQAAVKVFHVHVMKPEGFAFRGGGTEAIAEDAVRVLNVTCHQDAGRGQQLHNDRALRSIVLVVGQVSIRLGVSVALQP